MINLLWYSKSNILKFVFYEPATCQVHRDYTKQKAQMATQTTTKEHLYYGPPSVTMDAGYSINKRGGHYKNGVAYYGLPVKIKVLDNHRQTKSWITTLYYLQYYCISSTMMLCIVVPILDNHGQTKAGTFDLRQFEPKREGTIN